MNRREAAQVLEVRQMEWPMTPAAANPVAEVDYWATTLAGYPVEDVVLAMKSFRTREFAPTVGQIEEAINPTPTYADALAEFSEMSRRHSTSEPARSVPWSHPLIAAFAERHWQEWGQSPDGTREGMAASEAAARAHFRESFRSVQQRWAAGAITAGTETRELETGRRQIDA